MQDPPIRFDNGAEYEEFMGKWSQLAGDTFQRWLAPPRGLRWVDVGCGNGAFTEMLVEHCAPTSVHGIDPSAGQIEFARTRLPIDSVDLRQGDATALPYADKAFDAAVMALVIFFVPDPAAGVAEMTRVVKPGGSVSAYAWDMLGGGFPFAALTEEMRDVGLPPIWPPSVEASRMDAMRALWAQAGLVQLETREIIVQRTFPDFNAFWTIAQTGPRIAPRLAGLSPRDLERLKEGLLARLAPSDDGRITQSARANAIKGIVPT